MIPTTWPGWDARRIELLDYLAANCDGRQSLKDLHRTICSSAHVPQPAIRRRPHAGGRRSRRVDAGNRGSEDESSWLEAEAIRDAVLVACDKLDQRMGGPGFRTSSSKARAFAPLPVSSARSQRSRRAAGDIALPCVQQQPHDRAGLR